MLSVRQSIGHGPYWGQEATIARLSSDGKTSTTGSDDAATVADHYQPVVEVFPYLESRVVATSCPK